MPVRLALHEGEMLESTFWVIADSHENRRPSEPPLLGVRVSAKGFRGQVLHITDIERGPTSSLVHAAITSLSHDRHLLHL
jgi:hypothetical protein